MRYPDTHRQLDDAVNHVESALKNLSDRLEDFLPGDRHRRRLTRARRAIGRTTSSVIDRVPGQASALLTDTRRGVTNHPVRTALTAMLAGLCLWSLFRLVSNGRSPRRLNGRSFADRFRSAQAAQEEGVLRH
jgi:hypothetical protein